jgi:hypothetical protein
MLITLSTDKIAGVTSVPQSFSHKMLAQKPIRTRSGTVRITDSKKYRRSLSRDTSSSAHRRSPNCAKKRRQWFQRASVSTLVASSDHAQSIGGLLALGYWRVGEVYENAVKL